MYKYIRGVTMNITSTEAIDVIHAAFKRYETDPQPSSALEETAQTVEHELKQGSKLYGIHDETRLIAVVKCKLHTDYLYFSRLSVLPSYQGMGLAKRLLDYVELVARQHRLSNVTCKVRKSEQSNIELYAKRGYDIVAQEVIVNTNGDEVQALTMSKVLA